MRNRERREGCKAGAVERAQAPHRGKAVSTVLQLGWYGVLKRPKPGDPFSTAGQRMSTSLHVAKEADL